MKCWETEHRANPTQLDDCVEAFLFGLRRASDKVEIFNIGSEDSVDVKTIARIVIEEMGLGDVKLRFAAGVDGRGWLGDVKEMQLEHSLALAESEHRHEFR